jgi:putative peptidoglycan lipid II flippase
MLPHSVVTISIVTAILPLLSAHAIDGKIEEIHDELVRAIRLTGIVTVPSAIAFLLYGPLITRTLFFGISNADARYLGLVLCAFATGLLPLSVNLIALRGLNAFENVKLQVLSNAIMNIAASCLAFFFAFVLPAKWVTVGLAGAQALSYYVGAWTSIRLLRRYGVGIRTNEITGLYLRLGAIYAGVAVPLYFVMGHIPGGNTVKLLLVLLLSGLGYLGLAKTFKISEVGATLSLLLSGRR